MQRKHKGFFLLSFLPAIAYWILEENYPIRVALGVGLGLAVVEILIEKFWLGHIHSLTKFNFIILMFLGGISLIGDEGIWFKLQPAFTGVGVASFLLFQKIRGKSLIAELQKDFPQKIAVPIELTKNLESHMAAFMFSYGCFMAYVAFNMTTDLWLFYRTIGFYICGAIFFGIEVIVMRRWVRRNMKSKSTQVNDAAL